jgi:hypothetical protein
VLYCAKAANISPANISPSLLAITVNGCIASITYSNRFSASTVLSGKIVNYKKRLAVRPGITGLAQVWHKYDETIADVRKKVKYDLLYIREMCLMVDVRIILRTVLVAARVKPRLMAVVMSEPVYWSVPPLREMPAAPAVA